jgi:hypothetical protein
MHACWGGLHIWGWSRDSYLEPPPGNDGRFHACVRADCAKRQAAVVGDSSREPSPAEEHGQGHPEARSGEGSSSSAPPPPHALSALHEAVIHRLQGKLVLLSVDTHVLIGDSLPPAACGRLPSALGRLLLGRHY